MKKLRLHREVIHALAPLALTRAHGGGAPRVVTQVGCDTKEFTCPTVVNCPTRVLC